MEAWGVVNRQGYRGWRCFLSPVRISMRQCSSPGILLYWLSASRTSPVVLGRSVTVAFVKRCSLTEAPPGIRNSGVPMSQV